MKAAIERLIARVSINPVTGCWIAGYAPNLEGYAVIKMPGGKAVKAHRFAYEYWVGPIPVGLDLDHLCRVRNCVNPSHLEAVSRVVNISRGMSPAWIAWREDRCARGHSLEDAYRRKGGGRLCRPCALDRSRRRKERLRASTTDSAIDRDTYAGLARAS